MLFPPLPCPPGPPAGLVAWEPERVQASPCQACPTFPKGKGPRGPAEVRGGPIGPKVSRPLPQLFGFPGPYPVDQHQQKNHRQSRPFRRAALIQAVKAPDQTGGRHLLAVQKRTNVHTSPPPHQPCGPACVPATRHTSLFKIKSPKLEVQVEVQVKSSEVKSSKHHQTLGGQFPQHKARTPTTDHRQKKTHIGNPAGPGLSRP